MARIKYCGDERGYPREYNRHPWGGNAISRDLLALRIERERLEMRKMRKMITIDGVLDIMPNGDNAGQHKTGSLPSDLNELYITECLGFEPNISDDPDKVTASWCANVVDQETGQQYVIGVWDYKGVRWSTFGNQYILERIFKCSS